MPRRTGTVSAAGAEVGARIGAADLIVAGLDASAGARDAVDWAAAEASRRQSALCLVHAYRIPVAGYRGYRPIPDNVDAQLRIDGRALLDDAAETLRAAYPRLAISTQLDAGHPVTALRHASEHALLTVVGSRGGGRVTGILLGSVALAVVSINPVPVAVIHPEQRSVVGGPVVVGVDGSSRSVAAIAYAFESADRRQVPLVAVRCWVDPVRGCYPGEPVLVDPELIDEQEKMLLTDRIAPWRGRFPDVSVEQAVVRDRPTPTLLEIARRAQLVVVGSHGRGGFDGMLLGSTSQALVTYSSCPVVVAR